MDLGSIFLSPVNFSAFAENLGFVTTLLVTVLFAGMNRTSEIKPLSLLREKNTEPNTSYNTNLNNKPKPSKHRRSGDESFGLDFKL